MVIINMDSYHDTNKYDTGSLSAAVCETQKGPGFG